MEALRQAEVEVRRKPAAIVATEGAVPAPLTAGKANRQRVRGLAQRPLRPECLEVHWFATVTENKKIIESGTHSMFVLLETTLIVFPPPHSLLYEAEEEFAATL